MAIYTDLNSGCNDFGATAFSVFNRGELSLPDVAAYYKRRPTKSAKLNRCGRAVFYIILDLARFISLNLDALLGIEVKTLIVYATRYGATAGTAEEIAKML